MSNQSTRPQDVEARKTATHAVVVEGSVKTYIRPAPGAKGWQVWHLGESEIWALASSGFDPNTSGCVRLKRRGRPPAAEKS